MISLFASDIGIDHRYVALVTDFASSQPKPMPGSPDSAAFDLKEHHSR
ncbi:MAG TPA: hypothetical protein VE865_15800 [Bradyrhizobium sp.]|nr:hypothetical protein [Bradyrhizobium sp.]